MKEENVIHKRPLPSREESVVSALPGTTSNDKVDEQQGLATSNKKTRLDETTSVALSTATNDSQQAPTTTTTTTTLHHPIAIKCNTPTLYVSNLHPRITETHLELMFKPYGEIARVFFARSGGGTGSAAQKGQDNSRVQRSTQKGYAFVEYKTVNAAKIGIEKLDGRLLLGRNVLVRPAHSKQNSDDRENNDGSTTSEKNRQVRKQKYEVQNKIEALKRAIAESKKKRGS
jgi:hypothetical protein